MGRARGSIEGTQLPYEMIWEAAKVSQGEVTYDPGQRRSPLRLRSARTYFGFELDADERAIDSFPADQADDARRLLAQAMASGAAYHRDAKENRNRIRELREIHRRSGGATREASEAELTDYFMRRLERIGAYSQFMDADLKLDADEWAPREERKRLLALPSTIELGGDEYPLDYALEDGEAVVRARIPEKVLWQLDENQLPEVDRPLRWTVLRGKREAIRAASLEEARELASRPRAELRSEGLLVEEPSHRTGISGARKTPSKGGKPKRGGKQEKEGRSESRGNRRRQRNKKRGGRD